MMNLNLKKIDLQFNPDGHVHTLNGRPVPGCTSISGLFPDDGWKFAWPPKLMYEKIEEAVNGRIKDSHDAIPADWTLSIARLAKNAWREKRDKSAESGTIAHEIISQSILGIISGSNGAIEVQELNEEIHNILDEFQAWNIKTKPQWLASELQVGSETNNFAGILDALAVINGKTVLLDFKTSASIKDEYSIQLSGLHICLSEMGLVPDEMAILHLPKDGKYEYRVIAGDLESDKKAFLAGLEFYKQKNLFKARCKK